MQASIPTNPRTNEQPNFFIGNLLRGVYRDPHNAQGQKRCYNPIVSGFHLFLLPSTHRLRPEHPEAVCFPVLRTPVTMPAMPKRNFPEVRAWPTDTNVQDVATAILLYASEHPGELPRSRWIAGRLNLSLSTVSATVKAMTLAGALERFAAGATLKKANYRSATEAQRMVDRYRLSIGVE